MTDTTATAPNVNFFDPETNHCPYPAYDQLREEAPVWVDPRTGMFVLTRFEDIKTVLADPELFTNEVGSAAGMTEKAMKPTDPAEIKRMEEEAAAEAEIRQLYVDKGWVPGRNLDALDGDKHNQLRRMMSQAFRPSRIKQLDPYVEQLSGDLFDKILSDRKCEWVSAFAVPLPLYTIGKQMGVSPEDMPKIKAWTDAWVQRLGLMQTMEERRWSAEQEIEAQHFFQAIFERLRKQPEDTVLSDLVNKEIPEWGRTLTDEELHGEMMADIFVGGSETTTNALSAGLLRLIQEPELWDRLKSDPEAYLPTFIEEVVRTEGPVQGLLRQAGRDTELHGVSIPRGSVLNLRFAAGNRDHRAFECPADIDLERDAAKGHLAYGYGQHFCLGAALARRELYWGFKGLTERVASMRLDPDAGPLEYQPSYFLRGLKELHVELVPR